MHIKNEKKDIQHNDRKLNTKSGVSFEGSINVFSIRDSSIRYVINGIIMFFVAYGSVACFVTSFSISYEKVMLFFILFALAMLYSFMHISPTAHKIGYIAILISYLYIVLKLKTMIKSGFARIVNQTFEQISNKIYVNNVRKYTEYVENYKAATTLCLIIIGFVLLLILNIVISEYLNVTMTMILTLPLVIGGSYFGYKPEMYALVMYTVAIVGLLVLRVNSPNNVHNTQVKYDEKNEKDTKVYEFTIIPKIHAQIMLIIIIFVAIFSGIFTLQLKNTNEQDTVVTRAVKNKLNKKISKIISYDNGDEEISMAGGLSEGRLGDVPSIQYDNKEDLIVKFVPKSKENVYLRGYIGSIYENNRWLSICDTDKMKISNNLERVYGIYNSDRANVSSIILDRNLGRGANTSIYKMEVINVDADSKYVYMPYYTRIDESFMKVASEDRILASNRIGRYDIEYYPYSNRLTNTDDYYDDYYFNESQYATYVKNIYTQVPDKNKAKLKELCEKEEFSASDKNVILKIQNYFKKSYVYSLYCGTTPNDEDFVNYFIDTQKGFCAHFASTAALILRSLGIPTRYVEGYVITSEMIDKGKIVEDRNDYIVNETDDNSANAIEVKVPDNKAHAWIEVYKDGFGWVPYEMTVYNRREDKKNSNIMNDKSGFNGKDLFNEIKLFISEKFNVIKENGKNIMLYIAIVIISVIFCFALRILIRNIDWNNKLNSKEYNTNMIWLVTYLFKVFAFLGYERKKGMTVDEYFMEIRKNKVVEEDLLNLISDDYKKAGFSSQGISEEEYNYVKGYIEKTVKIKYNELSLKDKVRYIFTI